MTRRRLALIPAAALLLAPLGCGAQDNTNKVGSAGMPTDTNLGAGTSGPIVPTNQQTSGSAPGVGIPSEDGGGQPASR